MVRPSAPDTITALTPEEATSLQSKIDGMTDEQVEKVFAKMRKALGDRVEEELGSRLAQKMKESSRPGGQRRRLGGDVNPEMREKYGKELDLIEGELEKLYDNPLGIWQELATNPEAFMGEGSDDTGGISREGEGNDKI